ncbi:phenylalanine--tRNA ligase subunit beta [Candidatus Saccharibacteria bacterium]|nr:MAG: phenylalanine--tRNA ligase subunit beta [Candidatus Saccharibacteria bacterium]
MKISTNSIEHYRTLFDWAPATAPDGVDALVQKIGAQLGEVESVSRLGEDIDGAFVARVVRCDDHPNADKLHVCMIDDGGAVADVVRDDQGFVQVVCGAPNVRAGMLAAWLPPGAVVPESRSTTPFTLEARALRGVISNGMLASARELCLGGDHDGILQLDQEAEPGSLLADALGLRGDVLIDIENKMFTHRPDCFGLMGVARELAGIQGMAFTSPDWYSLNPDFPALEADAVPLQLKIEAPDAVPRFMAVVLRDVQVRPSPVWLQLELYKYGIRSINNIVDYTNYYMVLTGQPLHAYDYDKVLRAAGGKPASLTLGARMAKQDESLALLSGKTARLTTDDIVITANDTVIGLGGVMGGTETEVDADTTTIIVEVANFDMYTIRRTSMRHGLFTDAVTRFNKGQSPLQNPAVLAKMVQEVRASAGGALASQPLDVFNDQVRDQIRRESVDPPVVVTAQFINARLGLSLTAKDIAALLQNVEFAVKVQADELSVAAPFWRTDITIPEDVVEEVGRLYGYDRLPLELPERSIAPTQRSSMLELKQRVRNALAGAGANEVLTYSFVHGNLLQKVGQDKDQAFRLCNALSPDLQYYRLSLTPSLLEKVHPNIKTGYDEFAVFEIGKAHQVGAVAAGQGPQEDGLPLEFERLAVVYAAKGARSGAAYYRAKHMLMHVFDRLHIRGVVTFETLGERSDQATRYYTTGRAATVAVDGRTIGWVGEFAASVRGRLKLPDYCAGFELDLSVLNEVAGGTRDYRPLSRYPAIDQDVCLRVPAAIPYGDVYAVAENFVARQCPDGWSVTLQPVDIYQRNAGDDHKQVTLRFRTVSHQQTLTDKQVSGWLDDFADVAKKQLQAERV